MSILCAKKPVLVCSGSNGLQEADANPSPPQSPAPQNESARGQGSDCDMSGKVSAELLKTDTDNFAGVDSIPSCCPGLFLKTFPALVRRG